jgi:hypothetical protein
VFDAMTEALCRPAHAVVTANYQEPTLERTYIAAMSRSFLLILAALGFLPSLLFARDAREQQRIDFLLHSVETSNAIVFIRNGSEYDGHAAAEHLRQKLNYAGEKIRTAEQFIQYCASESSITHRKYTVRLANGATIDSATYFAGLLHDWDQQKH